MANLNFLLKYVRTGTAEGDRNFLDQIFILPSQYDQLCAIEPGGMRILTGSKGIGKSAVVEWIARVTKRKNLPCLLIRPDNIVSKDQTSASDIGSLKRYYYEVLLRTIGAQIGSQLKGFLKGSAAQLHNEARKNGLAQDDLIQKSLALISAISLPVSKINGVQLAKELAGENSAPTLVSAINTQLLSGGSVFYLLIDDTDQLASPNQAEQLNRIWGLLLAVRRLVGECESVRAIVTLRSSVWTRMTSESVGQRDQTDHLRGLVIPLTAEDKMMQTIIRRRLENGAKDAGKIRVDPYSVFFDGDHVILPSSDAKRSWDLFITKSARERPRDAIQLIKNMIDSATKNRSQVIGSKDASDAMKLYSTERVDDITNEFSLDCRNIKEIIDSFGDVDFEIDFETLRKHLITIGSISSTSIRSETIRPGVDSDGIKVLSLLHETGFINARVPDTTMPKGYRHILFHDDANFVRMENWNGMQGAHWEIHPAFRTYLLGIRQAQASRVVVSPPKY
jgi:hypothetical protein